jgi:hypothetical protein
MNRQIVRWALALAVSGLGVSSLMAQGDSGPLIDALVKKGVLSSQEGEEIRAEMLADYGSTPGGMLTYGSSAVKGLKLYGDARVRYQYTDEITNNTGDISTNRNRYRYRVRVGADYLFAENWKAGVRLESSNSATSTNNDFGAENAKQPLQIGLVYLQYTTSNPTLFGLEIADSFDLRLGKHLHPFYFNGVNGFLWDTDTNPEGISEQIGWTNVGVDKLNVTLRGGQYIFRDRLDSSVIPTGNSPDDEFTFVAQAEVNYEWAKKSGIKVAPGYFGTLATSNANTNNAAFSNQHDHHQLVFFPAEVYWNMWGQPWKVYGTYGINLDGENRSITNGNGVGNNAYDQLFNVGVTVGSARNKGSWSLTGEYRYIEAGAANAFFLDSDFNGGLTNASGFILSGSYAFTDNIAGTVTFFNANNLDKTLPATPNPTGRGTGFGSAQVLQVDLSWRF